jgi:single-strand DNA-binding protein
MSDINVNRVVLVGRLTHDPELRALPSGTSVCELQVACNSSRKDPSGGYREKPNYFTVSAYGGAAESANRYLSRGSRVAIDGRLEWQEWETHDGRKRQSVKILADTVQFLDSPGRRRRGPAVETSHDRDWEDEYGDVGREDEGDQEDQDSELVDFGAGSRDAELVF